MHRQFINYAIAKRRKHFAAAILFCLLIGFLSAFLSPGQALADDDCLPPNLQAKLLLTVLAYDKNLPKKTTDSIGIGLLYFPSQRDSRQEAQALAASLEKFKEKKINGLGFTVHTIPYSGEQSLRQTLQDSHLSSVCLIHEPAKSIKKISEIFKDEKVLSCGTSIQAVKSGDLSLHIGIKQKKPKIYINHSSAVAEGSDFSAKFLRVAEVVDQ